MSDIAQLLKDADVIPGPKADPFTDDELHERRRDVVNRLAAPDHWSASEIELQRRNARWLVTVDARDAEIYRLRSALIEIDVYLANDPDVWRLVSVAKAGDVLCDVLGAEVIQSINTQAKDTTDAV